MARIVSVSLGAAFSTWRKDEGPGFAPALRSIAIGKNSWPAKIVGSSRNELQASWTGRQAGPWCGYPIHKSSASQSSGKPAVFKEMWGLAGKVEATAFNRSCHFVRGFADLRRYLRTHRAA